MWFYITRENIGLWVYVFGVSWEWVEKGIEMFEDLEK